MWRRAEEVTFRPYQAKRSQYWPEVEHYFSHLPPRLFRQGVLLQNNLATFYAETGQFKDILCRAGDHPLLYLHLWLLDDWGCPSTAVRSDLEKHLFLAMLFAFAAVYTQECIRDEGTNFDRGFICLAHNLARQSDRHLAYLFTGSSPFWNYHRDLWQETAEAALITAKPDPFDPGQVSPPDPRSLAFTKISAAAVACNTERVELWASLGGLLDRINLVWQIGRDFSTLRRDLARRHYTYPLLRTMQAAGLEPLQPVTPERILGALVVTGVVEQLASECRTTLETCRAEAVALNLPTLAAYLPTLEKRINQIQALFSLKHRPDALSVSSQPRRFFVPFVDTLPAVIKMAEGYLLADLTFGESWEVQRRGLFGVAEMTAKAFPSGLIVEILCRQGHPLAGPVDEIFATLQATGLRYYDHPHLPPDTDDLALLLRLYPYSAQPGRHRHFLLTPLLWLEQAINDSDEIPVWLTAGQGEAGDEAKYPLLSLWGQSCATVEANVLLGLIDYDWSGYRPLIERIAANWSERVIHQGLGATHHYVPLYALWVAFRLITKLSRREIAPKLRNKLSLAAKTLTERLELEAGRSAPTPQDAAFLILTGLAAEQGKFFRDRLPDWVNRLCKSQRYDGSWADEPLFGTPTRGELAAWYSSRSVTTAFCYHALKLYREM